MTWFDYVSKKIDEIIESEKEIIKCNFCNTIYWNEDELESIPDGDEFFKGCSKYKTDEYLMDIREGVLKNG